MIGVSEERDPAGIKLMRRAGLDSKQYISVSNKEYRDRRVCDHRKENG